MDVIVMAVTLARFIKKHRPVKGVFAGRCFLCWEVKIFISDFANGVPHCLQ